MNEEIERLAFLLAEVFFRDRNLVASGPQFVGMEIRGGDRGAAPVGDNARDGAGIGPREKRDCAKN
ncbi:MAG: hypothetical protein M3Y07_11715 [Acidobacteriota bacterium]|nr:hypothetical protein [Acidobacteriota bacterium]